jgi:hypothetical protein
MACFSYSKLRSLVLMLCLLTLVVLPACAPAVVSGPRDQCGFIEPTQEEVNRMLSFGGDLFSSPNWVKSYFVEPYKITLSRHNDAEFAVAYMEYLIYTCGYTQADIDAYFSNEGFNIVFEGYESHIMTNFCEVESLALYEFDLIDEGADYVSNYWVEQTDDNHMTIMMLVFPKGSPQMDEYSQKLFPKLTACQ